MKIKNEHILRIGIVISVTDPNDGCRIKARILTDDDGLSDSDLPYAFPLLPKMVHITPKVGEAVIIITPKMENVEGQRYYIGPIIHQSQFMDYDGFISATSLHDGGSKSSVLPSLRQSPNAIGALCNVEDISFKGRGDSDIILREKEMLLRCGVRLTDNADKQKVIFNKTNPTYIKLKYHDKQLNDRSKSSATIVSERINLIGTNSSDYFNVSDNNELITDEVMNKII